LRKVPSAGRRIDLSAALLGALFVPSFWCRLFCPVGQFLNEIVRLHGAVCDRLTGSGKGE